MIPRVSDTGIHYFARDVYWLHCIDKNKPHSPLFKRHSRSSDFPKYLEHATLKAVPEETKKILCIEDDTFLINLIIEKFMHANILATRAATGSAGVAVAMSDRPDLILLDLMLPDMPGLDVLEKLKNSPETEHIPIIIFTNLSDKVATDKALSHGALKYLIKSDTLPSELVDIVTNELKL